MPKPYTVVAILEAKIGKENDLKLALEKVVEPSRNEATNLEFRLHQDVENPEQFVLYENWQSQAAHQQQFTKPYIQELAQQIGDLLAKPFQIICAQEL